MSEYQYYEFQALDRRLTEAEMAAIRALSSRVNLTARSAIFLYNYGDFRGDPEAVLAQYFDAFLYLANWGTRRLAFRLPPALVDKAALQLYTLPDTITLEARAGHLLLDIQIHKEEGEWIDTGEGRLTPLTPLRDAILAGDYRALYLAWLRACELALDPGEDGADAADAKDAEDGDEDEYEDEYEYGPSDVTPDTLEPPVPPNLKQRDAALDAFVEFFEIDPVWLAVAAEASPALGDAAEPLAAWIQSLPVEDCRRLLVRVVQGEPNIAQAIRKELRDRFGAPAAPPAAGARRTAGQLAALVQQRKRRAADERRRRDARARAARMEALAGREAAAWDGVLAAIEQRTPRGYDEAVGQLRELHELAEYRGDPAAFGRRLAQLLEPFSRLSGLRSRLAAAGLLPK